MVYFTLKQHAILTCYFKDVKSDPYKKMVREDVIENVLFA